jgi:citrate synthase
MARPSVELPIYSGTIGPDVIDIRKLYAQTGMFTYDPGFLSTASCQSAITYIDGDKGELLYRGYPIEQLATQCDYPGNLLPAAVRRAAQCRAQKADFVAPRHASTPWCNEQMQFFLRGFRRDAHPMAVLTGLVGCDVGVLPRTATEHQQPVSTGKSSAIRLIAKMPTLVAMAYKYGIGQPYIYPAQRSELRRRTSCA